MEKRLKWVKIDLMVIIILALLGNISTFINIPNILTILRTEGVLEVIQEFVIPFTILGLLIAAYIKYKTDINAASIMELIVVIIYFINAIRGLVFFAVAALVTNGIFGFSPLTIMPILMSLLPFIIPIILLVDVISIRKLYKSQGQEVQDNSKKGTKALVVGVIIFVVVIIAVLTMSYFAFENTLESGFGLIDDEDDGLENLQDVADELGEVSESLQNQILQSYDNKILSGVQVKSAIMQYMSADDMTVVLMDANGTDMLATVGAKKIAAGSIKEKTGHYEISSTNYLAESGNLHKNSAEDFNNAESQAYINTSKNYNSYLLKISGSNENVGIVFVPEKINNSQVSNTEEDEATKGWSTYTNAAGGYSFKYPSNLAVTTGTIQNMAFITKKENVGIADVSEASIRIIDRNISGKDVTIGNINTKYSSEDSGRGYAYYSYEFSNNGKNYEFRLNDYDDGQTISLEVFKTIVGSLKFID